MHWKMVVESLPGVDIVGHTIEFFNNPSVAAAIGALLSGLISWGVTMLSLKRNQKANEDSEKQKLTRMEWIALKSVAEELVLNKIHLKIFVNTIESTGNEVEANQRLCLQLEQWNKYQEVIIADQSFDNYNLLSFLYTNFRRISLLKDIDCELAKDLIRNIEEIEKSINTYLENKGDCALDK